MFGVELEANRGRLYEYKELLFSHIKIAMLALLHVIVANIVGGGSHLFSPRILAGLGIVTEVE